MSLRSAILRPIDPQVSDKTFDLNVTNNYLRYDVREWSTVAIAATKQTSWGTAVLTVYRSLDGYNPFALETAETLGPGDDVTGTIDTSAVPFLIVKVTTLEGSQKFADITATGKASA